VNIRTFIAFGHKLPYRRIDETRFVNINVFEENFKELDLFLMRMYRHFLSLPGVPFAKSNADEFRAR
jgi:hypothetical protein